MASWGQARPRQPGTHVQRTVGKRHCLAGGQIAVRLREWAGLGSLPTAPAIADTPAGHLPVTLAFMLQVFTALPTGGSIVDSAPVPARLPFSQKPRNRSCSSQVGSQEGREGRQSKGPSPASSLLSFPSSADWRESTPHLEHPCSVPLAGGLPPPLGPCATCHTGCEAGDSTGRALRLGCLASWLPGNTF